MKVYFVDGELVCLAVEIAGICATRMCVGYYPPVRMAIYLGNNTTCHGSRCISRKGNLVARESMY